MRIQNGRTLGDFQGKVTYIGYNGVSTIDYILASEIFLMRKYIHSFNVEELTSLSDHRPLTLKLKYIKNKEIKEIPTNLLPKPKRFCIKNIETYRKKLENEMNLNTITSFAEKLEKCSNDKDINNMAQEITNLYIDSLNPKYKKTKKQGRSKNKRW